ncbi:MAG: hypothetical protein IPJ88_12565 [Myxococcales bacterium]|nr:MAG: hypothetical protein IPJ88_12565 [Myxococcales bacterium]
MDARSDIFSAGSVLYELVCGKPAFQADNEMDLIYAVREAAPVLCQAINPKIPLKLARIVEKSMFRSRSGRYQTAIEFRDALLDFLRNYNPHYTRTKLADAQRKLWAKEINLELRAMEEFAVGESDDGGFGTNLIADALGPNAPFSSFNPSPTHSSSRADKTNPNVGLHQVNTAIVSSDHPDRPSAVPTARELAAPKRDEIDETAEHDLPGEPTEVSEQRDEDTQ